MTLQEAFPNIKFYTAKEACEQVGFEFDYNEAEEEITNIRCCGQSVNIGGVFGADFAYCKKCGKRIQNITGFCPCGNAYGGFVDFKKNNIEYPQDNRVWFIEKKEQ